MVTATLGAMRQVALKEEVEHLQTAAVSKSAVHGLLVIASHKVLCPSCQVGACRRSRRWYWLDYILGWLGWYPWLCNHCLKRIYLPRRCESPRPLE